MFIHGQKPGVFLLFIIQSYFGVPKNVILNSTHYFIINIQNKCEHQEIAFNHSSDIECNGFYDYLEAIY